jgi:TnpA family transposase
LPCIHETVYPRFKSSITQKELEEIYTPTEIELNLSEKTTRGDISQLCFLILLKCFQRLGYFIPLTSVPNYIIQHIISFLNLSIKIAEDTFVKYNNSGTRLRHVQVIREYLNVKPYDTNARHIIVRAVGTAAKTKNDSADLINIAIEELIRQRYELPAFSTVLRASNRIKVAVNRSIYYQIFNNLREDDRKRIDYLLETEDTSIYTPWNLLRQDSGSPTLTHLKDLVKHLTWLTEQKISSDILLNIPDVKIKHFAAEAKTLNASRMKEIEPYKRYALATSLLSVQLSKAFDDLAEMFIKRMMSIHRKGKEALELYRKKHTETVDKLIFTLKDIVIAYKNEGTIDEKFSAIESVIGEQTDDILSKCEAHTAYSGNNYYPFLWKYYKSHRVTLFGILKTVEMYSTSQDKSLEKSLLFIQTNENKRSDWINTINIENKGRKEENKVQLVDLNWISDSWWRLVTGNTNRGIYPDKIDRRYFEICLFSQVMWDLKSGDLYIKGSDKYSDYREQLLSWEEYEENKVTYGQQVNLPVESKLFINFLKNWLHKTIQDTDQSFPLNQYVRIENNEPIIRKSEKKQDPEDLKKIEGLISKKLQPINILDILTDTELWLNWTKFFYPISGHEAKVNNPVEKYLITTFCYGCNLGTTQTARSLEDINRNQISWINQRHISEDKIDQAIRHLINSYNCFILPKYWGTGKRASADGTKWDLYEQNLLSEYHIRYGGYGGIGYYHISDTYIALFSHFIPCGVWEAVYILDGLLKNESDIQPDIIHADTQGQNAPVFGLSFLLGINLMPRIRNWKDLKFYRAYKDVHYTHIDELFSDTIDWDLIETHLPDMFRVALSIKAGRITPSTILRKLSTYSKKNRLYQAFRELGRVIRTGFLITYMMDEGLRSIIQAATNKSEAFNGFTKWLSFGGEGIIAENDRDEQRKIIKYNHLVANCVIFYNVFYITKILQELIIEGYVIGEDIITALSPYIRQHVNRFGRYSLDLQRKPPSINYNASFTENVG